MKKYLFLVTFILSFSSWAQQRAVVEISAVEEVYMGDILNAQITVWPRESFTQDSFLAIEGKTIAGDSLYIGAIKSARPSENNSEALVADLLLVALKAGETKELSTITLGERVIPLRLEPINIKEAQTFGEKFLSLDQGLAKKGRINLWVILGAMIGLAGGLYLFIRKRRFHAKEIDRSQWWKDKISQATSRQDFEELYAHRDEWVGKVIPASTEVSNFLEELYRFQYQREWSSEQREKVQTAYNSLKERARD